MEGQIDDVMAIHCVLFRYYPICFPSCWRVGLLGVKNYDRVDIIRFLYQSALLQLILGTQNTDCMTLMFIAALSGNKLT